MKAVNKAKAYADLKYIKEKFEIDTSNQVKSVANSDSVPVEVVLFINKYKPLEQFYTYNKIYENRRKNPLYKNLVNENLSEYERAIALSSFVTQTLIHNKELIKENKQDDREQFIDIMNLDTILDAIKNYSNGNSELLNETFLMVRDVFKKLF